MTSFQEFVQKSYQEGKKPSEIAIAVLETTPLDEVKLLALTRLRQLIAIVIKDPDQIEFAIDGELFPLDDVPANLLEKRGRRLIAAGKRSIIRGEAYLAAAKEQRAAGIL